MATDPWSEEAQRLVIRPQADRNRVGRRMMLLGGVACGVIALVAWRLYPTLVFLAVTPGFIVLYGAALAMAGRPVVVDGRKRVLVAPGRPPLPFGEVGSVRLDSRRQTLRTADGIQHIEWWRLEAVPQATGRRGAGAPVTLLEMVDRERVRRAGERVARLLERPLEE